jgi:penicillin-binding protein 1A
MPRPPSRARQVIDAQAAYQMVHIMEGVVERGTATVLRDLDRPLFGKTGTTSGPTNVWFVGGTPEIVAGVYLGYDQPRPMGHAAQGGRVAAPVFKQFAQVAFKDEPKIPFVAPAGIRMVRIDRVSGKRVFGEDRERTAEQQLAAAQKAKARRPARSRPQPDDFLQRQGGIY